MRTCSGGGAMRRVTVKAAPLCGAVMSVAVAGCAAVDEMRTAAIQPRVAHSYSEEERECLERAIYFESNRSSEEGLLAVATVVMNRAESDQFPDTICGVVGQKNQFAPGVLTRHMPREKVPDIQAATEKVLLGYRHDELDNAMFFHMAGLTFPYDNMHYKIVAGGNAFYEKR